MTIREIIYVPDHQLRQKATTVKEFPITKLQQLVEDMLETMRHHAGVGLAGPQIGLRQRIFVAEIPLPNNKEDEPHPQSGVAYALINPEIIKFSGNLVEGKEGCLSLPGWAGFVDRPAWVEIKAQDIKGQPLRLKVDGLLARIFMHEIDHLNGILYTDHITDPEKLWEVDEEREQTLTPAAV